MPFLALCSLKISMLIAITRRFNVNQAKVLCNKITKIKLSEGAQTCVLPPVFNRDFKINLMTLKLEIDLDILKMYF